MDPTRRLSAITFDGVAASRLSADAAGVTARLRDIAWAALAAEQVGAAEQCLDMTVEYAKLRKQYGRAIGSFQAIKHRCVDLLVEIETARSAVYSAAAAVAEGSEELPLLAAMAKSSASDAAVHAAAGTIQMHGGIGFTWEHDAHLYFRRAKESEHFLGSPRDHRETVAGLLLSEAGAAQPG